MRISMHHVSEKPDLFLLPAIILIELCIALVVIQGHSTLILLLLGGLTATILMYRRPAMGAALILAFAPLEGAVQLRGHSLAKLITVLCIGLFLMRVFFDRRDIKIDLTAVLLLPFVLWTFTSLVWSPDQSAVTKWISFALQVSLYFVLINLVQSEADLNLVIWGFILGGTVLAVMLTNSVVSQNFLRKGAVAGLGVNLVARLIALNFILSFLMYQIEHRFIGKAILIVSMILSILGLVVSLSRGAWVASTLSIIAVVAVYAINGRLRVKPATLFWLLITGFVSFYILNRFLLSDHGLVKLTTRFQDGISLNDNAGGRFDIWLVGWNMFADSPFWGHGFESFSSKFLLYAEQGNLGAFAHQESKTAHNSFVGVGAQFGFIGLGLFLAVLISAFYKVRQVMRDGQPNVSAQAAIAALAVFLVIANCVDYAVDRKYLWFVLALIALMARYRSDTRMLDVSISD